MSYPTTITAEMSAGQILGPAMKIKSQEDADAYFEILVLAHMRLRERTRSDAERETRESIGYFAGYYDYETRERVEKLFRCQHPIFGPIATARDLTAQEIFEMGYELGKENRESKS